MPIIRGHHSFDNHFTQIPNHWLRDTRLSFKARGVLALIISHTSGWSLSIEALAKQNQEGKDAIRSAIQELEQFGYLVRQQENLKGRFGEAIWITTDPADEPMAENPTTENPTPKNNNIKEEQVKNTKSKEDELFPEFWNEYPLKKDKGAAFKAFRSALKRAKFEDILAGAIAYAHDPQRKPEFTKYPATWLNADAWENVIAPSPDSEAALRIEARRERERKATQELLRKEAEAREKSAPAPKCKHGKNIALCNPCLRELEDA